MTKAQYAPTPWRFFDTGNEGHAIHTAQKPGERIAKTVYEKRRAGNTEGYAESEANAKRIVHCVNTYDELLEALELVKTNHEYNGTEKEKEYEVVCAAITKAKGE